MSAGPAEVDLIDLEHLVCSLPFNRVAANCHHGKQLTVIQRVANGKLLTGVEWQWSSRLVISISQQPQRVRS
jgi:hypothetical protein